MKEFKDKICKALLVHAQSLESPHLFLHGIGPSQMNAYSTSQLLMSCPNLRSLEVVHILAARYPRERAWSVSLKTSGGCPLLACAPTNTAVFIPLYADAAFFTCPRILMKQGMTSNNQKSSGGMNAWVSKSAKYSGIIGTLDIRRIFRKRLSLLCSCH